MCAATCPCGHGTPCSPRESPVRRRGVTGAGAGSSARRGTVRACWRSTSAPTPSASCAVSARTRSSGPRAAVVNLDYRFPLTRIDRGLGTLPAFARVVHGAVFVDAGHAWVERFTRSDVTVSVGAELSLDAVVGYVLPLTFTAGGAWVSQDRGFVGFARIGRAF